MVVSATVRIILPAGQKHGAFPRENPRAQRTERAGPGSGRDFRGSWRWCSAGNHVHGDPSFQGDLVAVWRAAPDAPGRARKSHPLPVGCDLPGVNRTRHLGDVSQLACQVLGKVGRSPGTRRREHRRAHRRRRRWGGNKGDVNSGFSGAFLLGPSAIQVEARRNCAAQGGATESARLGGSPTARGGGLSAPTLQGLEPFLADLPQTPRRVALHQAFRNQLVTTPLYIGFPPNGARWQGLSIKVGESVLQLLFHSLQHRLHPGRATQLCESF